MIGSTINNRYRIDAKLGSGGMADVYRAYDLSENRVVAIKVLKKELTEDLQYLRRFTREATAMLSLSHENIVSLYDVGDTDELHYLVIEYVDGCTLRDYIKKNGALSPHVAVEIACKILDGLAHAHSAGIVHRDVKPQNVMISNDRRIKLADFGIAKFADNSTRTYEGGEALGSVYYLSPEQAKGENVDLQADLYSVGIMLYEMLVGKPPFTGENAVQVALKHLNEDVKAPSELDNRIPVALSDVVIKATSKDKEVRYSSADTMREELLRTLKHPRSRFARIKSDQNQNVDSDKGDLTFWKRFKKYAVAVVVVIGVLAFISLFVVMFLMWLSNGSGSNGYVSVPNLVGSSEEEARIFAENRDFEFVVSEYVLSDEYEAGEVCRQAPSAKEKAKPGTVISVTVSLGMETTKIPELFGLSVTDASNLLVSKGLVLDENIEYITSEYPVGTVVGQFPLAEELALFGDSVRIVVSTESVMQTNRMPDLTKCANIGEAAELLHRIGIENYRVYIKNYDESGQEYEEGQIISQSPANGIEILYSSLIVEIYMHMSDIGEYKAEFAQNFSFSSTENEVVITMLTDIGEIVVYDEMLGSGEHYIPVTAYYWDKGNYLCRVYVNGVEYTSYYRTFS